MNFTGRFQSENVTDIVESGSGNMRLIPRSMFALLLLAATSGFANADVSELSTEALQAMIADDVIVIDVRRDDEWKRTGLVAGSHPITFFDARGRYDVADWLSQVEAISDGDERTRKVVLICARGVRSSKIAKLLDKRLGFQEIYNVTDGINHWIDAGKPVEKFVP